MTVTLSLPELIAAVIALLSTGAVVGFAALSLVSRIGDES